MGAEREERGEVAEQRLVRDRGGCAEPRRRSVLARARRFAVDRQDATRKVAFAERRGRDRIAAQHQEARGRMRDHGRARILVHVEAR
jgi:hypothetical protein